MSVTERVLKSIDKILPGSPKELVDTRRINVKVNSREIREAVEKMRGLEAHLSTITCVDELDKFTLIYHFDIHGCIVNIYAEVNRAVPVVDSIVGIYPVADFYEREVREMFGVEFRGHPRPVKFLLPDDWPDKVHPLKRGGEI